MTVALPVKEFGTSYVRPMFSPEPWQELFEKMMCLVLAGSLH